ncbi:MAG TPA: T9SS type A sorting domain-containing protein, partial [Puia sp.]|nr:T9SS type A sorting domain-containing protein [Puia sp.]
GVYPITQGTLSAGNNYTIVYTGNTLTIAKAQQQIAWTQTLVVGCNDTTEVILAATANSGLTVSYTVADTNIAKVSGNVLSLLHPGTTVVTAVQKGDSNHLAASPVTDTVVYEASSLVSEHWTDALLFDNSSGDYVAWQWYKNGQAVAGANNPFYSDTPTLNGQYFVIATNQNGQRIESCLLTITANAPIPGGIKVFPNPATAGAPVTISCNYPRGALQGAVLQLVDINGKVRQKITSVQESMQVTMPSDTGIYVINLQLANGQRVTVNVLVIY